MGHRLAATLSQTAEAKFDASEADRTIDIFQLVLEFHQVFNAKFTTLSQRLSELDKAIDAIMHDLEVDTFDMYQAFVTLKRLQVLRKERRKVKSLLEAWREVKHSFGKTDVQEQALSRAISRLDEFYNYMGISPRNVGDTAAD
jgi:uncharacterized iron-regulated protein